MDNRTKALIGIGASVTANCEYCIDYHVGKAKEAGAGEREISMAIEVGKAIRNGVMNKMDRHISTVSKPAAEVLSVSEKGCDCDCSPGNLKKSQRSEAEKIC